jgi:hypothetical protein
MKRKEFNCRRAATGQESEPIMSKTLLSTTQKIVNSVWRAVRMLEERPTPPARAKLNGRRGYGDGDIPAPEDRSPNEK